MNSSRGRRLGQWAWWGRSTDTDSPAVFALPQVYCSAASRLNPAKPESDLSPVRLAGSLLSVHPLAPRRFFLAQAHALRVFVEARRAALLLHAEEQRNEVARAAGFARAGRRTHRGAFIGVHGGDHRTRCGTRRAAGCG